MHRIDDHIKAKCGAPLRVELVDGTGAVVFDSLPSGMQLEVRQRSQQDVHAHIHTHVYTHQHTPTHTFAQTYTHTHMHVVTMKFLCKQKICCSAYS